MSIANKVTKMNTVFTGDCFFDIAKKIAQFRAYLPK